MSEPEIEFELSVEADIEVDYNSMFKFLSPPCLALQ